MEETQQRRFWLIELIAYWEGRLTTTHLREFFGISRQQASADISASGPPFRQGSQRSCRRDWRHSPRASGRAAWNQP